MYLFISRILRKMSKVPKSGGMIMISWWNVDQVIRPLFSDIFPLIIFQEKNKKGISELTT